MKAKLKGYIASVTRREGEVSITLGEVKGKTDPMKHSAQAQNCFLDGEFTLKASVANEMPIGSVLTITITDEEKE